MGISIIGGMCVHPTQLERAVSSSMIGAKLAKEPQIGKEVQMGKR